MPAPARVFVAMDTGIKIWLRYWDGRQEVLGSAHLDTDEAKALMRQLQDLITEYETMSIKWMMEKKK